MRGIWVDLSVVKSKPIRRRMDVHGLKISIETDAGEIRHWYDPYNEESGSTKFKVPYGYVNNTTAGGDDPQIDCFIGSDKDNQEIYIIHQMRKPDFKEEDELKCMISFESPKQAKAVYLQHYDDPKFFGSMETMNIDEFKDKYVNNVEKNLPGRYMGATDGKYPANPNNPYESSNHVETPENPWDNNNNSTGILSPGVTIPQPQPGLNPLGTILAPGTIPMGPPPIDVETLEGVEDALKRVGSMKDPELIRISEKIWGPGYQFIEATADHVRAEVIGFLLDQRDYLQSTDNAILFLMNYSGSTGMSAMPASEPVSPNSGSSSEELPDGNQNTILQSSAQNSSAPGLDQSSSTGSHPTDSSMNMIPQLRHTQ